MHSSSTWDIWINPSDTVRISLPFMSNCPFHQVTSRNIASLVSLNIPSAQAFLPIELRYIYWHSIEMFFVLLTSNFIVTRLFLDYLYKNSPLRHYSLTSYNFSSLDARMQTWCRTVNSSSWRRELSNQQSHRVSLAPAARPHFDDQMSALILLTCTSSYNHVKFLPNPIRY